MEHVLSLYTLGSRQQRGLGLQKVQRIEQRGVEEWWWNELLLPNAGERERRGHASLVQRHPRAASL